MADIQVKQESRYFLALDQNEAEILLDILFEADPKDSRKDWKRLDIELFHQLDRILNGT